MPCIYGFATLHWRAARHGELVIGLLWRREWGVHEIVRFAFADSCAARADRLPIGRRPDGGAVGTVGAQHGLAVLVPAQALHAASSKAPTSPPCITCVTIPRRLHASARLLRRDRDRVALRPADAARGWLLHRRRQGCVLGHGRAGAGGHRARRDAEVDAAPCEVISWRHASGFGARRTQDEICGLRSSAPASCCRDLCRKPNAMRCARAWPKWWRLRARRRRNPACDLTRGPAAAPRTGCGAHPTCRFGASDVSRMLGRPWHEAGRPPNLAIRSW